MYLWRERVKGDETVDIINSGLEPLDEQSGYRIRPGFFRMNGAYQTANGVSFTISSHNATSCTLLLFKPQEATPFAEIEFPESYRIGDTYSMLVYDLKIEEFEYAFRLDGPNEPEKGMLFNKNNIILDPYAKALSKPFIYNMNKYLHDNANFIPKAIVVNDEFDWQGVGKPTFGRDSLIIYECNVKGLTAIHPDVPLSHRGKYLGVIHESVIKHLKDLGITAVQFNPIAAFISEPHLVKKGLVNYWGYNPVCFMAPDPRYAVNPLEPAPLGPQASFAASA